MPWTVENPPDVSKSWTDAQKRKCVGAANATLRGGGSDEDAIFACINAAGMSNMERVARFAQDEPFDVEILRTGTWQGATGPEITFKSDDLHDMVTNFELLKSEHSVAVKRGHTVDKGDIALGWIDTLWVEGDRLLAKFAAVPKIVREAIQKNLFRKVSIEAMKGVTFNGKKLKGWVLDAVAILGAEVPAVSGLKDLGTYLASRSLEHGTKVAFTVDMSNENEEVKMDKDIQERFDALEATVKASQAAADKDRQENEELKAKLQKAEAEKVELQKKETAEKVEAAREAAEKVLDEAVKAKAIIPAQRESFAKLFKLSDDQAVVELDIDELRKAVDSKTKAEFSREKGSNDGDRRTEGQVHDDPSLELDRLAKLELDKQPTIGYGRALEIAMERNPELAKEHVFFKPEEEDAA